MFTLDLAPEPVILPPLGSQRPTPHIPLTPASIPSLHFHDKQKINQPLFCQFGFHTPLPLYLKTKFPIFALISQPTFKHNNNKLLQGREEGMSQDWGLAHSPCLSGSDWVRGWRHGRGGRPRSRTSPRLLPTQLPTAHDPCPQLPGAPKEPGMLTGPPAADPPGWPNHCLLHWNFIIYPSPPHTHTHTPSYLRESPDPQSHFLLLRDIAMEPIRQATFHGWGHGQAIRKDCLWTQKTWIQIQCLCLSLGKPFNTTSFNFSSSHFTEIAQVNG